MVAGKSVKSAGSKPRKRAAMVRTNIVIDRDLVERVKQRTGATSAREAVHRALEQAAARFTLEDLRALRDLNPLRPNYDPEDPMAEERAERAAVAEQPAHYVVTKPEPKRRKRT